MEDNKQAINLSLEERVARLEGAMGWTHERVALKNSFFIASVGLLILAAFAFQEGLGLPNHYYQFVFAALTVALCYHRGWFALPARKSHWMIAIFNAIVLTLTFKLLIGLGEARPFSWIKAPTISSEQEADENKWVPSIPKVEFSWEQTDLGSWTIDFTVIQTFLLILTLIAALFDFQPFASMTAFLLILLSVPALLGFSWPWVFWGIIFSSIAFYLQTPASNA